MSSDAAAEIMRGENEKSAEGRREPTRNKERPGMRHGVFFVLWRSFFRICVAVTAIVMLLALSYFMFTDWWNRQLLNVLLNVPPLERPEISREAADDLAAKIERITESPQGIYNETWDVTELAVNSLLDRRMHEEKAKLGNRDQSPEDTSIIADSLSEAQVRIEDGRITIACNVDMVKLAPLAKERLGWDFPEDLPKSTVLLATAGVTVSERVMKVSFETIYLGNMGLKDSIFAGVIGELAGTLEGDLRNSVRSQIPGSFEAISQDEIEYRLPENVESVEVLPKMIRITFRKN